MTIGSKTYKGLAVPLYGESEIKQSTAATDVLTVTRISGGTGDMLVVRDADATETFVVKKKGWLAPKWLTTAPTTGLVKGDICWLWSATSFPKLGICTSSGAQTLKYIGVTTKTFARDSMP